MKRFWLIALLLWPLNLSAQTLIGSTTLAAAVTSSQTSILVTTGSGWAIGQYAYVDYEVMRVVNVSGTLIGVTRQQSGTRAVTHAIGTLIMFGNGAHFKNLSSYQNSPPIGSCVRASQPYLPIIDYTSGNIWSCDAVLGKWIGTNTAVLVYNTYQTQ